MRDRVFYSICFGFIFGVLLRSFVSLDLYFSILLGGISFALILFFTLVSGNKWGVIFSIFVLTFSFGIFRFDMADVSPPAIFEMQVGKNVSLTGMIVDDPDLRENNQKITVEVLTQREKVRILATADFGQIFRYGDTVRLEGKLNKPDDFITDQGKEFGYVDYLRKDKIFYLMNYSKIEIISSGGGNFLKRQLFTLKDNLAGAINRAVTEPESVMLGALILGNRSAFSQTMRQSFIDTGTIHIVTISGYHVSLVARLIMQTLSFLPIKLAAGGGVFAILFYVIMTGGAQTAIRAGIMGGLALFARTTGRNYVAGRILILAGAVMILVNPLVLVYDVSFQLSFLATTAVIFLTPKFEQSFLWIKWKYLREIVSVTFAAYIFVLPFILYKMGNLSVVAILANVLILPFLPITMVMGFVTGFSGLISSTLALFPGFVSYLFLHYKLYVVGLLSSLPFAALSIPNFPFFLTLLIYACFVYKLFGKSIKNFFGSIIEYNFWRGFSSDGEETSGFFKLQKICTGKS